MGRRGKWLENFPWASHAEPERAGGRLEVTERG